MNFFSVIARSAATKQSRDCLPACQMAGRAALAMTILLTPPLFAADVEVQSIYFEDKSPSKYVVKGTLVNQSADSREVTYLAQITFYEKSSPPGDRPASILRKNGNVVLRPGEKRSLAVDFVSEASPPRGSMRLEPKIRIRRERPWSY